MKKNITVSQMSVNLTLVMSGDICSDQKKSIVVVVVVRWTLLLSCISVKFRNVTLNQPSFVQSQLSLTFINCRSNIFAAQDTFPDCI